MANESLIAGSFAMLLALAAAPAEAAKERYASNAEVLQDLRRSQASGDAWAGFLPGAYAVYRKRGHSPLAGDYDERHSELLDGYDAKTARFKIKLGGGSWQPWLPLPFELDFLDASRATRLADETVTVMGRSYDAEVYRFEEVLEERRHYLYHRLHTFWINHRAPGGVLRHLTIKEELNMVPATDYGGTIGYEEKVVSREESDTKLDGIDVRFTVDGKELRCVCTLNETGQRDQGEFSRSRVCRSERVPGGVVRAEVVKSKDGQETGNAVQELVEFEGER